MTETYFGKRGLVGAPSLGSSPSSPRRMRSGVVVVGMVGAAVFGGVALAKWRSDHCPARDPLHPENRPSWCDSHGGGSHGGYYGGGGGRGSGSSVGHASFGGFGFGGFGHGGGS